MTALFGQPLSVREVEILRGIACGGTNGTIARELYLAEATVKHHVRRITEKLGSRGRAHAISIGYAQGVLGDVATAAHERALLAETARSVIGKAYVDDLWLADHLGCEQGLAGNLLKALSAFRVVGPSFGRSTRAVLIVESGLDEAVRKIWSGK